MNPNDWFTDSRSHQLFPPSIMTTTGSGLRSKEEIVSVFDLLRSQLDNHQDTRERLIKASRDITGLSKKLIFLLHRIMTEGTENGPEVAKIASPKLVQIEQLFAAMKPDLEGDKFWRYQRAVSPGLQEYIEALSFAHYLTNASLVTWEQVQDRLSDKSGSPVRFFLFLPLFIFPDKKSVFSLNSVFSSADRRISVRRVRSHGRTDALRHHRYSAQRRQSYRKRRLHLCTPVQDGLRDPHPSLEGIGEEAAGHCRIAAQD